MRRPFLIVCLAVAGLSAGSRAETAASDGARLYGQFCAQCHGAAMVRPTVPAFDLRVFPADQHDRFVNSVLNGKRTMPAWDGTITPAQVESLWAYVLAAKSAPSN